MSRTKYNSRIFRLAACLAFAFMFQTPSRAQTVTTKSGADPHWSVQVQRIDPGNAHLSPSFRVAIYENLLQELSKTKRFEQVLRDGDRNAKDVTHLLVLKTTIEKYTPGSETRRAVTTVTGATKLTARSQLLRRDGTIVFEGKVNGAVRFIGSNLRATQNLARNVAKTIKKSSLSESERVTATVTQSATGD